MAIYDIVVKLKNIILFSVMISLFTACSTKPVLGLVDDNLKPCPNSPNCVSSSSSTDKKSYVAPIFYKHTNVNILDEIIVIIDAMPRTTLLTRRNNYLHFEFRTF